MADAPPPTLWAADRPAAVPASPSQPSGAPAGPAPPPASADDAERAWRHARRAGGRDDRAPDLYDALVHAARETQYTLQPPGVSVRGGNEGKRGNGR